MEGANPHFRMVIDRRGATDDVEIQVEVSESMFTDTVSDLVEVEERVAGRIRQVLGISPKIRLVEPRTLEQLIGKSRHVVIDKREL